jgi:acylphosphatase
MALLARHFFVSGRVQGVGFRHFTWRTAHALGACGWVRNLPDGGVEVWAEGSGAVLDAFQRALETGPSGSHVAQARGSSATPAHYETFEILR